MKSLVDTAADERPIDIPAWTGTTHRLGCILHARQKISKGLPPSHLQANWTEGTAPSVIEMRDEDVSLVPEPLEVGELVLGVERAEAASTIIIAAENDYRLILQEAFREGGFEVAFNKEAPSSRYAPGIVIDFPAFVVSHGSKTVATGRLCVTVCLNQSRSKVWLRLSCNQETFWGSDPCKRLKMFSDVSRNWFSQMAPSIVGLYGKHIEQALREDGERDWEILLTKRGEIELISCDVEGGGLPSLSAAMVKHLDLYSDPISRKAAGQLDAMVSCLPAVMEIPTGVGRPAGVIARGETGAFNEGRYHLISHATVRGSFGVFIARTWGENLVIAGVSGSTPESSALVEVEYLLPPGSEKDAKRPKRSPSQQVTAEVATKFAKYF